MGAAVATLISYVAVYAIRAYDTRKFVSFKLHTPLLIINVLLLFVQSAIMYSGVRYSCYLQAFMILLIVLVNLGGIVGAIKEFIGFLPKRHRSKK